MIKREKNALFPIFCSKTNLLKGLAAESLGELAAPNTVVTNDEKIGNYKPVSLPRILN